MGIIICKLPSMQYKRSPRPEVNILAPPGREGGNILAPSGREGGNILAHPAPLERPGGISSFRQQAAATDPASESRGEATQRKRTGATQAAATDPASATSRTDTASRCRLSVGTVNTDSIQTDMAWRDWSVLGVQYRPIRTCKPCDDSVTVPTQRPWRHCRVTALNLVGCKQLPAAGCCY
jgi:hypothetical protein